MNTNGTPWPVRPGIYKKAATRVKGDPMTFVCPSDFYPVVDTAERRIWMCTQQLSVLMRLPCPVNANTKEKVSVCTVDYEKTYGESPLLFRKKVPISAFAILILHQLLTVSIANKADGILTLHVIHMTHVFKQQVGIAAEVEGFASRFVDIKVPSRIQKMRAIR